MTYIDQLCLVSGLEIVQDGRIVQKGQVGHVLALLVLGWIHLSDLVLLEFLLLKFAQNLAKLAQLIFLIFPIFSTCVPHFRSRP